MSWKNANGEIVESLKVTDLQVEVHVFTSEIDGATVVQIDTEEGAGHTRIYLNEADLFDGDPETDS